MTNDNFDFGGNIEDDSDVNPPQLSDSEASALSVYGLLVAHCGHARGKAAYEALLRNAVKATKQHGGVPGILFDEDGGRFVAVQQTH